jgi:aldehyde dehydrogenase (NAD+)
VAQEEIFGPVVAVIRYRDAEEAVALANDSIYGLGGAVFTTDLDRGYQLARRIRTGTVAVNGFAADFATPFGGVKQSGVGREGGRTAVDEYLELKTISVPVGYEPADAPGASRPA